MTGRSFSVTGKADGKTADAEEARLASQAMRLPAKNRNVGLGEIILKVGFSRGWNATSLRFLRKQRQ